MSASDIYRKAAEALDSGRECFIAILTETGGSTPQRAGAKMLIYGDGATAGTIGGGDVERKLIKDVLKERPRAARTVRYQLNEETRTEDDPKMSCGGNVTFYVEPVLAAHRLVIVGGGHCGVELSRLAAQVGFAVTVLDPRAEWANRDKHPLATVVCAPYEDAPKQIAFSPDVYIVVMTHGHEHDEQVLRDCLEKEYRYLGVIGSARKAAAMLERLRADGISEALLARVRCPIGVPIPSHTPAEIAVSIAAELIAVKNGAKEEKAEILKR